MYSTYTYALVITVVYVQLLTLQDDKMLYINKFVLCGTLLNAILLDSLPLDTRFAFWQQKILKVLMPDG